MLLSFDYTVFLLVEHSFVGFQERHVTTRSRVLGIARVVDQLKDLDEFISTGFSTLSFGMIYLFYTFPL